VEVFKLGIRVSSLFINLFLGGKNSDDMMLEEKLHWLCEKKPGIFKAQPIVESNPEFLLCVGCMM